MIYGAGRQSHGISMYICGHDVMKHYLLQLFVPSGVVTLCNVTDFCLCANSNVLHHSSSLSPPPVLSGSAPPAYLSLTEPQLCSIVSLILFHLLLISGTVLCPVPVCAPVMCRLMPSWLVRDSNSFSNSFSWNVKDCFPWTQMCNAEGLSGACG